MPYTLPREAHVTQTAVVGTVVGLVVQISGRVLAKRVCVCVCGSGSDPLHYREEVAQLQLEAKEKGFP